jgi:Uma2 family endonuclease
MSIEQYLDTERKADFRSEYVNGHVYATSGGTLNHARIVRNTLAQFAGSLRGARCEAVGSDLRLFCSRYNVFTYPDVVVTRGPHKFLDGRHDVRQRDGSWLFREFTSPGSEIEFNSIDYRLTLESLYERVDFEAET